jgi:hypothetical protein
MVRGSGLTGATGAELKLVEKLYTPAVQARRMDARATAIML